MTDHGFLCRSRFGATNRGLFLIASLLFLTHNNLDLTPIIRIKALEKIIQSGVLNSTDRTAAVQTLTTKAQILAHGATKRGKHEEAEAWLEIRDRYV